MERRLLLDVVVRERAVALELLLREDEALLVGWDALASLDLLHHLKDRTNPSHEERDRLACGARRSRLDDKARAHFLQRKDKITKTRRRSGRCRTPLSVLMKISILLRTM